MTCKWSFGHSPTGTWLYSYVDLYFFMLPSQLFWQSVVQLSYMPHQDIEVSMCILIIHRTMPCRLWGDQWRFWLLFVGNEGYQSVQTTLPPGDLVQSAVVVSSTPGGTVFLEPQAVTLTELPGGTVQTLPAGSTFEGNQSLSQIQS